MENMFAVLKSMSEFDFTFLKFKKIWLDPANGSDYRDGTTLSQAVKTLAKALSLATAGKNDTIMLVGDGTTAATCRLDAALDWNKNATHLVGVCSESLFSQRARIAPTGATTAFANFLTVSASGCMFRNIQLWHDFDTDGNNQIALTISGHRNVFKNCHVAGIAKGTDAGGRCIKFSGGQENLFEDCVIGIDTIDRAAANVSIEFAAGAARNVFRSCIFPMRATATSPLLVTAAAAAAMDRFNLFVDVIVYNHGASIVAGLCTLAASAGGYLGFVRPALLNNITGFGTDATSRGQIVITGPTDGSTVSGKGYAPNA